LKQILSGIIEVQRNKGVTMTKRGILRGAGLALALILAVGAAMVSTAQAQRRDDDRRDRRERAERNDRWNNSIPSRGHENESWRREQWEREHRNGYRGYPYGNYGYYGPYRNYGYYGGYPNGGYYGGGYPYGGYGSYGSYGGYYGNSGSEAHGYHDGYNRGREDAHSGRYPTPNNSEHFRNGNPAYRAGFARGYRDGYGSVGGYGNGGYRPF
jgi:hypothetical protein